MMRSGEIYLRGLHGTHFVHLRFYDTVLHWDHCAWSKLQHDELGRQRVEHMHDDDELLQTVWQYENEPRENGEEEGARETFCIKSFFCIESSMNVIT